jgi:hypothetical protein
MLYRVSYTNFAAVIYLRVMYMLFEVLVDVRLLSIECHQMLRVSVLEGLTLLLVIHFHVRNP